LLFDRGRGQGSGRKDIEDAVEPTERDPRADAQRKVDELVIAEFSMKLGPHLFVDREVIDGEERYRSVGITNSGRFLLVVWMVRDGKVRAVTAFPASVSNKKTFLERSR